MSANYTQNVLEITIPKVSEFTSGRYIAKIFYENKVGMIRSIKFVNFKIQGMTFKRAIIQMACWFNTAIAENIQNRILKNTFAKMVHKDENAWKIVESTSTDKDSICKEHVYFKIQDVSKYGMTFKGEVQQKVDVYSVLKQESNIQYVFYNEPKNEGEDIKWAKRTPLEILKYMSHLYEVLVDEDDKIVEGLRDFAEKRMKTVARSVPRL
jgi:hypothetical protein